MCQIREHQVGWKAQANGKGVIGASPKLIRGLTVARHCFCPAAFGMTGPLLELMADRMAQIRYHKHCRS